MTDNNAIMKYYHRCIEEKNFKKAISWLLHSGIPHSKSLWTMLSQKVHHQPELQWFCSVHAHNIPKESDVPNMHYQDILQNLPTTPSLTTLYKQASAEEKSCWELTTPPSSWEDTVWRIPILLYENKLETLCDWVAYYTDISIEAMAAMQILTHLHQKEFLDFFCSMFLWKKTWGQRSARLLTSIGHWCAHDWNEKKYTLTAKALFLSLIPKEERILLADQRQVHTYDIEEHAFFTEIEPQVIERNRSKNPISIAQSLYAIIPIIDDLGSQATDSALSILTDHIRKHPQDTWAKATILYLSCQAQSVSIEYSSDITNARKSLFGLFPNDALLACYDETKQTREKWTAILPSKEGYRALLYQYPNDEEYKKALQYYTGQIGIQPSITPFSIKEEKRERPKDTTAPSILEILVPTIILFAVGIWILGASLSYLH